MAQDISIKQLVEYAVSRGLIEREDVTLIINSLLDAIGATEHNDPGAVEAAALEDILRSLTDYALEQGRLEGNSVTYRDLFDTRLMGILTPRPSSVIADFRSLYAQSPQKATDWYYRFSRDTDYIRTYRVARDLKWKTQTKYGKLDITVNLSKPEKDPKAIAAAKLAGSSAYPKCQLCAENEGYPGRVDHPARQNHRVIPIAICSQPWGFQYSPYVYYNEHCIVFNKEHVPMIIDKSAFAKLFDFVRQFPHYFVGSNADLPIVGGSILTHEHFQGGRYEFAMERAEIQTPLEFKGFEAVKAGIVNWPMSVIRLCGGDSELITELADKILTAWRGYTDESAFIFAQTDGVGHSTVTPIARRRGSEYELDLVLRNNITTPQHPLGVFHPHAELHHIKKENIGLIEVMGLAVLPPRLLDDINLLEKALVSSAEVADDERIASHAQWVHEFLPKYDRITPENVERIIHTEIGLVFERVLEHAGVFKRTEQGSSAFMRFIGYVNNI